MEGEELEILYQAMASKRGLCVRVSNFVAAQARFYKARAASGDPALACLTFRRSPVMPDEELWIVRAGTPIYVEEASSAQEAR